MPLREDETKLLETLSLDVAWPLVETFATIPREAPADCDRAAGIIVDALREAGVPVTVHEPELYLALPRHGSVRLGGATLFAKPSPFTASRPDGVTARLVHVRGAAALPHGFAPASAALFGADYLDRRGLPDLTGAIAVYEGLLSSERIQNFERLGAVGVIAVNPGDRVHWGGGNPIWGAPDLDDLPLRPRVPAVAVSRPDGARILQEAAAGGEATIVTELDEGWFRCRLPVAEIRGGGDPDRFVLLHGHYDAWDVGVGDNATGDAAMVELARNFWRHREHLARSIRVAWWPGHSTGRFAGSTWYADTFAHDLDRNCVAHINCDSPGCRDAIHYHSIPLMAENEAHVRAAVADAVGEAASGKRPSQSSDFSFNNLGITGYFSSSSRIPKAEIERRGYYFVMGNGGNVEWHTDDDLMDVADRDILLRDLRVYALAVWRNATAPVLPYDWRALLAEFRATVAGYAEASDGAFDFAPSLAAIDALDGALAQLAQANLPAVAANDLHLGISRRLVALNYTRSTRFRRDPGVPTPPLPWLAVARDLASYTGLTRGFALTHLTRGQNHVVGMLDATRDAVNEALSRSKD